MDFVNFVYLYFGLTALLVFVLLFGDSPAFQRTPVSFGKWLVTEAWLLALERVVEMVFGERGLRMLDKASELFCESRNPFLQVAYILIITVGYGLFWQYIFRLLPKPYAPEYHIYTGTAAVCATLTCFLQASMSDPGRLTAEEAALYLAAYPPDGVLFPPKQCSTCDLARPGRSKHCSACGSCIIRFDHHCGWINNCVGLCNTRTFLAFLAANLLLCCYGTTLAAAVLLGDLQQRGFFDVYLYDPVLRDRVALYTQPSRFIEWIMVYYPIQIALIMFLAVTALLMLSFILYQAYGISMGRTTYETLKRNQLLKDTAAAAAAARVQGSSCSQNAGGEMGTEDGETNPQDDGDNSSTDSLSADATDSSSRRRRGAVSANSTAAAAAVSQTSSSWWTKLFGWRQQQQLVNYYDRGVWGNWCEVLWPDAFLQQHRQQLAAHSKLD